MSYEQKLLIRKSDLDRQNRRTIEKTESLLAAYRELSNALKCDVIEFPEIELVIISPELTAHNLAVRELLNDLNIEYKTIL